MRIIFFGTSEFAVPILQALVKNHEIVLVVTEKAKAMGRKKIITSSPVEQLACELNLKIITPESIKSLAVIMEVLSHQSDINIVAAYGKIIPVEIFNAPPFKTINIHPSLLPKLRGASPIQAALEQGLKETGVSLMIMENKIDHGPIISQDILQVNDNDNYLTLESKLSALGSKMLIRDLPKYASGEISVMPQDELKATHTRLIKKEDGHVDWSKSAEEIYNQWRAFIRWPGIYTFWKSNLQKDNLSRLKLIDIKKITYDHKHTCGTVFLSENNELLIACSKGAIQILQLQPESKKILSSEEFLNGYREIVGQRLL